MTLRDAWEAEADNWAAWARRPGNDSYSKFHRDVFLELLPPPGRRTLDVGCGEGRLARDLKALGHRVVALDAARLPLPDEAADLVVAFMSLQDVEDLEGAIGEAARVLEPGGRLCFAILHPVATAGRFEDGDAAFAIRGQYVEPFLQTFPMERDIDVPSFHRPIEGYSRALERAGFLVERLRELPTRRRLPGRIPTFLHVRALKT